MAQVVRGTLNTRAAVYARIEEKVWHQDTGSWVDVDLRAEEKSLAEESPDEDEGPSLSESKEVKETDYYDFLNVKPGAPQTAIKKAYFKMALVYHPDKDTGDTQKFQKLSEVYQVLSDPDARKKYDRDGADGLQKPDVKIDPRLFFSLLFGSEHFVPWIGELNIATQAADIKKMMEKGDATDSFSQFMSGGGSRTKRQHHRQVRCAVHLRDKLDGLVARRVEVESWNTQMRMEARQMAVDGGQFGPALLSTLGKMYQVRSELYLAGKLAGWLSLRKIRASVKQSLANMQQMASFYLNAALSIRQLKKIHGTAQAGVKEREKGEIKGTTFDEEEHAKKLQAVFDEVLPTFMETVWAYAVRDIDETVKVVASKFLQDKSVPWQIRIRRGEALNRLGHIFTEEGRRAAAEIAPSGETKEFMQGKAKAALEEALLTSMQQK